jgi:hypothetical protein
LPADDLADELVVTDGRCCCGAMLERRAGVGEILPYVPLEEHNASGVELSGEEL